MEFLGSRKSLKIFRKASFGAALLAAVTASAAFAQDMSRRGGASDANPPIATGTNVTAMAASATVAPAEAPAPVAQAEAKLAQRADAAPEPAPAQEPEPAPAPMKMASADTAAMAMDKDDPTTWEESVEGFPVTHELTVQKCSSCHAADEDGNLSRISWTRTTPEAWSQTIKRMVALHGLPITPDEAREVVKYLANNHGLAPEEAKPVMYMTERRILDETIIPDETMRQACASCHAFGQVMSARRTKNEWALLQNMHAALYPTGQRQMDRRAPEQPDDAAEGEEPVTYGDVALEWLTKNAPLRTSEWSAWQARMGAPRLKGKWLVSASLRGEGTFFGEMMIEPGESPDMFTTKTVLRSLDGDAEMTRSGKGLVYTGYSWRGTSSSEQTEPVGPASPERDLRETMWFAPDQQSAEGRWYWGEYHEFGFDVTLTRTTGAPVIAAIAPGGIKRGAEGARIEVFGDALPTELNAADIDFGPGVNVTEVLETSADRVLLTVDVEDDAPVGLRNVSVGTAFMEAALPVIETVDYLKVTPETALSRLGGIKYAKGYERFAAYGYSSGADGKPETDDDIALGEIAANWSMEEFHTTSYDNDVKFVGALGDEGLFTPAVEGPNPERRFGRNNYGEVWIVATAKDEKDEEGKPLSARSYLVVTVPTYQRWDQPEIAP